MTIRKSKANVRSKRSNRLRKKVAGLENVKDRNVTNKIRKREKLDVMDNQFLFDVTDEEDNPVLGEFIFISEALSNLDTQHGDGATFVLEIAEPKKKNWKAIRAKRTRGEDYVRLRLTDAIADRFNDMNGYEARGKKRIKKVVKPAKISSDGVLIEEAKTEVIEIDPTDPDTNKFVESRHMHIEPTKNPKFNNKDLTLHDVTLDLSDNPDLVQKFASMQGIFTKHSSWDHDKLKNLERKLRNATSSREKRKLLVKMQEKLPPRKKIDLWKENHPDYAKKLAVARGYFQTQLQQRADIGEKVSPRALKDLYIESLQEGGFSSSDINAIKEQHRFENTFNEFLDSDKASKRLNPAWVLQHDFEEGDDVPLTPIPDRETMEMFKRVEKLYRKYQTIELEERSDKEKKQYVQPDELLENAMEEVEYIGSRGIPPAFHETFRMWFYQKEDSYYRKRLEEMAQDIDPSYYRDPVTDNILPTHYGAIDMPDMPLYMEINPESSYASLKGFDVKDFYYLLQMYGDYPSETSDSGKRTVKEGNVIDDLEGDWSNPLMVGNNAIVNIPIGIAYGFVDWIEGGMNWRRENVGTANNPRYEFYADGAEINPDGTFMHVPVFDMRSAGEDVDGDIITFNSSTGRPVEFAGYQRSTIDRAIEKRMGTIQLPTGAGKCIRPDTYVLTEKGIVKIGTFLHDRKSESDEICEIGIETFDFEEFYTKSTSHIYQKKSVPVIDIKTDLGIELGGTPHHRIVVLSEDGSLQWKYISNIEKGDMIAIRFGSNMYGNMEIPKFDHTFNQREKKANIPSSLSIDLGYLMGLMLGDGSFRFAQPTSFRLSNSNRTIINRFRSIIKKIYGVDSHIYDYDDGRVMDIQVHSNMVRKHLIHLGLTPQLAHEKIVPYTILSARKEIQTSFLRGLFDSDGSIDGRGNITFSSSSKELAKQVQLMLLNIGIVSRNRMKSTTHHNHYEVKIVKDFISVFHDEINFSHPDKRDSLELELIRERNTNVNKIPFISGKLKMIWDSIPHDLLRDGDIVGNKNGKLAGIGQKTIQSYFYGYRDIPPQRLRLLLDGIEELYPEIIEVPAFNDLYRLTDGFYFTAVTDTHDDISDVYDFVVPDTHSFVANGMINHNTEVMAGIFAEVDKQGVFLVHTKDLAQQAQARFEDRLRVVVPEDKPKLKKLETELKDLESQLDGASPKKREMIEKEIKRVNEDIVGLRTRPINVGIISSDWLPQDKGGDENNSATMDDDITVILFGSGTAGVIDINDMDSVFTQTETITISKQHREAVAFDRKKEIMESDIPDEKKEAMLEEIDKALKKLDKKSDYQQRMEELEEEREKLEDKDDLSPVEEQRLIDLEIEELSLRKKSRDNYQIHLKKGKMEDSKRIDVFNDYKNGEYGKPESRKAKEMLEKKLNSVGTTVIDQRNEVTRHAIKKAGIVGIDEVHHVPADTFQILQENIHAPLRFGLSATPWRDGKKSTRSAKTKKQSEETIRNQKKKKLFNVNQVIVNENRDKYKDLQVKIKEELSSADKKKKKERLQKKYEKVQKINKLVGEMDKSSTTKTRKREIIDEIQNINLEDKNLKSLFRLNQIPEGDITDGGRLSEHGTFGSPVPKSSKMIESAVGGYITRMWASDLIGEDAEEQWLIPPEILFLRESDNPIKRIAKGKEQKVIASKKDLSVKVNPARSSDFAKSMKAFDDMDKDALMIAFEHAQITSLRDALLRENTESVLVFRGNQQTQSSPSYRKKKEGKVLDHTVPSVSSQRWTTEQKFAMSRDWKPKYIEDMIKRKSIDLEDDYHVPDDIKRKINNGNIRVPEGFEGSLYTRFRPTKVFLYKWEFDPNTKKRYLVPSFEKNGQWKRKSVPAIYEMVRLPDSYMERDDALTKGAIPIEVPFDPSFEETAPIEMEGEKGDIKNYYAMVEVPRKEVLEKIQDEHPDTIVATSLADEGLDAPRLAGVNLADDLSSRTKLFQRIGRGIRPHPDERSLEQKERKLKKHAVIIDQEQTKMRKIKSDDKMKNRYEETTVGTNFRTRKNLIEKYEKDFNVNTSSPKEPLDPEAVRHAVSLQSDYTLDDTPENFPTQLPEDQLPENYPIMRRDGKIPIPIKTARSGIKSTGKVVPDQGQEKKDTGSQPQKKPREPKKSEPSTPKKKEVVKIKRGKNKRRTSRKKLLDKLKNRR